MARADDQSKLQLAISLYQSGNTNEAAKLCREIIKKDSDNFHALHFLGVIEAGLGNIEQAKNLMARSLSIKPPNIQFVENYATLLFQSGDYKSAYEISQKGLAQNANSAALLYVCAISLFKLDRLQESQSLFDRLLLLQPNHFVALNERGSVLAEMKQFDAALASVEKALVVNLRYADAHLNKGNLLSLLNRQDEALAAYEKALSLNPNLAYAWLGRGNTLRAGERFDEALAAYDKALALKSDLADAWLGRGNVLNELKRYDEAFAAYDKALELKPDLSEAWLGRGNVFKSLKRLSEASAAYDKALALKPDLAEAWFGRGNILFERKRHDDASAAYDKALALKPDFAEGWLGRGNVLFERKRYDEASSAYDKAIELKPAYADAFYCRGNVLKELNRLDEALASYDKALALKPDHAVAQFARCMAELPVLYENEQEIIVRRTAYGQRLTALCEMADRSTNLADLAKGVGASQPFYLAYQGYNDRDLQALYGSLICQMMAEHYAPATLLGPPAPDEPIRVGIVSGFFRHHTVWKLMIAGWISQFDRRRFRVFGYSTGTVEDAETQKAATVCDRFMHDPLSTEQWRQAILADAPHVLLYPEVGMDPITAQLAAQRLAPVQCVSWGHPETTGYPTLDYFLSSDLMEPPDAHQHYTERLIRLPNLSIYYEPYEPLPVTAARTDFGLRSTAVVYWSGQSLYKYLPQYDHVYPSIAQAVGDCQFVFIEYGQNSPITDLFRRRLDRAFSAVGLRASDYCVFLPRLSPPQFVAAAGLCDVVLDSLGWSGGNTTLECLNHDLPIVTMIGPLMRGRHTFAFLKMMDVTDTITESIDDYVSIAIQLGQDSAWRTALKSRIAENKHRIYRDRTCIVALEDFLERTVRGT